MFLQKKQITNSKLTSVTVPAIAKRDCIAFNKPKAKYCVSTPPRNGPTVNPNPQAMFKNRSFLLCSLSAELRSAKEAPTMAAVPAEMPTAIREKMSNP